MQGQKVAAFINLHFTGRPGPAGHTLTWAKLPQFMNSVAGKPTLDRYIKYGQFWAKYLQLKKKK